MFPFDSYELLGIALASVASIVIGALWYSPYLFGQTWMREIGLTEEKIRNSSMTPTHVVLYAISLDILFAVFMNVLFTWIGVRTVAQGTIFAVACSATFFCIPLLVHYVFDVTSKKAWLIYATHELLFAGIAGMIVSWSILQ